MSKITYLDRYATQCQKSRWAFRKRPVTKHANVGLIRLQVRLLSVGLRLDYLIVIKNWVSKEKGTEYASILTN